MITLGELRGSAMQNSTDINTTGNFRWGVYGRNYIPELSYDSEFIWLLRNFGVKTIQELVDQRVCGKRRVVDLMGHPDSLLTSLTGLDSALAVTLPEGIALHPVRDSGWIQTIAGSVLAKETWSQIPTYQDIVISRPAGAISSIDSSGVYVLSTIVRRSLPILDPEGGKLLLEYQQLPGKLSEPFTELVVKTVSRDNSYTVKTYPGLMAIVRHGIGGKSVAQDLKISIRNHLAVI